MTPQSTFLPGPSLQGVSPRTIRLAIYSTIAFILIALTSTYFHARPERGSMDFDIDPIFNLPRPPHAAPFSKINNIIEMLLMTVVGLVGVVLGARDARRSRSLLPLILPISGVTIAFWETFLDVMGGLYYPWVYEVGSFHALGRVMPPWIPVPLKNKHTNSLLSQWFGYGAFMQYNLLLLQSNPPTKSLWKFWFVTLIGDLVIEEILLPMGIYRYYGNQPLIILNLFPWWWLPCNSVGVILAASLAFRFQNYLKGWKALVVQVSTPMCVGATYGFIAFPSWVAVNSDYPWIVTQFLGLITLGLGFVEFCLVVSVVLERNSFMGEGRAPLKYHESNGDDGAFFADDRDDEV